MKNKRKIWPLTAAATACMFTAIPVYADTLYNIPNSMEVSSDTVQNNMAGYPYDPNFWDILNTLPTDPGNINYIIDFFDPDGNILDSRVCQYGEKLENIKIPEPREDGQYIYEFLEWDPQLAETVTECMSYTAVYRKIDKSGGGDKNTVSGPEMKEDQEPAIKASSDGQSPDEITQVSSTSYDVTPFRIVTPAVGSEGPDIQTEVPVSENTAQTGTIHTPSKTNEEGTSTIPAPSEDPNPIYTAGTPIPTVTTDPYTMDLIPNGPSYEHIEEKHTKEKHSAALAKPLAETPDISPAKTTEETQKKISAIPTGQALQDPPTSTAQYTDAPPEKVSKTAFPVPILLTGIATWGGTVWFKDKKNKHL